MIQCIGNLRAKQNRVRFAKSDRLVDRQVQPERRGPVEEPPLEHADFARTGMGEHLTCEGPSSPSAETPLLSRGLMALSAIRKGPSPVIRNRTMSSSSGLVSEVTAVFSKDRIARLIVPRPDRIDNGAPDCQETTDAIVQPLRS